MSNEQANPTPQAAETAILPRSQYPGIPLPEFAADGTPIQPVAIGETILKSDYVHLMDGEVRQGPHMAGDTVTGVDFCLYFRRIDPAPQAPRVIPLDSPEFTPWVNRGLADAVHPVDLPVTPALTHTPTPWHCDGETIVGGGPFMDIRIGDGSKYGDSLAMLCNRPNTRQDAEFIVTAVNSHASLLEAVTQARELILGAFEEGVRFGCEEGIRMSSSFHGIPKEPTPVSEMWDDSDSKRSALAILEAPALVGKVGGK